MALFKILRGNSSRINLADTPFKDGYCYFATDTGLFYIDYEDAEGNEHRIPLNSNNTSGIIDQNSGLPLSLWYGPSVELPPEEMRDPYTIYITSDEEENGNSEANIIEQIQLHNINEDAHEDIREAIDKKAQVQFVIWEADD